MTVTPCALMLSGILLLVSSPFWGRLLYKMIRASANFLKDGFRVPRPVYGITLAVTFTMLMVAFTTHTKVTPCHSQTTALSPNTNTLTAALAPLCGCEKK